MKFTTSLFSQILQVVPRNSFSQLVYECMPFPFFYFSHGTLKFRGHIYPDGQLDEPEPLVLSLSAVAEQISLVCRGIAAIVKLHYTLWQYCQNLLQHPQILAPIVTHLCVRHQRGCCRFS